MAASDEVVVKYLWSGSLNDKHTTMQRGGEGPVEKVPSSEEILKVAYWWNYFPTIQMHATLGVMAHTYNPAFIQLKQDRKFQASLG